MSVAISWGHHNGIKGSLRQENLIKKEMILGL